MEARLNTVPWAPEFLLLLAGDCRLESGSLPSCKCLAQTKRRACIDSSEGKGNVGPQIRCFPDGSRVQSHFPLFLIASLSELCLSCGFYPMAVLFVWFLNSPVSACLAWDEVCGLSAPLLSSSFNDLNAELVRLGSRDEVLHLLSPASPCLCVAEHPGKPFLRIL